MEVLSIDIDDKKQSFLGDPSGLMRKKEYQAKKRRSLMILYMSIGLNVIGIFLV